MEVFGAAPRSTVTLPPVPTPEGSGSSDLPIGAQGSGILRTGFITEPGERECRYDVDEALLTRQVCSTSVQIMDAASNWLRRLTCEVGNFYSFACYFRDYYDRYESALRNMMYYGERLEGDEYRKLALAKLHELKCLLPAAEAFLEHPFVASNERVVGEKAESIVAELRSLKHEFSEVRYVDGLLEVVTDPITLYGVDLGPFRLSLDIQGSGENMRVTAEEPNVSRNGYSHPHVGDDVLCFGEGGYAATKALRESRYLDYFTLARSALSQYNAGSPYEKLSCWVGCELDGDGDSCASCGYDDSLTRCRECSELHCSDCNYFCESCSDRYCGDHIRNCNRCDGYYCTSCLDDGRCLSCVDAAAEEDSNVEEREEVAELTPVFGRSA